MKLFLTFIGTDPRFERDRKYTILEITNISGVSEKTIRARLAGYSIFNDSHIVKRMDEEFRTRKITSSCCQSKSEKLSAEWLKKALV